LILLGDGQKSHRSVLTSLEDAEEYWRAKQEGAQQVMRMGAYMPALGQEARLGETGHPPKGKKPVKKARKEPEKSILSACAR